MLLPVWLLAFRVGLSAGALLSPQDSGHGYHPYGNWKNTTSYASHAGYHAGYVADADGAGDDSPYMEDDADGQHGRGSSLSDVEDEAVFRAQLQSRLAGGVRVTAHGAAASEHSDSEDSGRPRSDCVSVCSVSPGPEERRATPLPCEDSSSECDVDEEGRRWGAETRDHEERGRNRRSDGKRSRRSRDDQETRDAANWAPTAAQRERVLAAFAARQAPSERRSHSPAEKKRRSSSGPSRSTKPLRLVEAKNVLPLRVAPGEITAKTPTLRSDAERTARSEQAERTARSEQAERNAHMDELRSILLKAKAKEAVKRSRSDSAGAAKRARKTDGRG